MDLAACKTLDADDGNSAKPLIPSPGIVSPLYQEVVYSGQPQPLEARAEVDVPLEVIYYPSPTARWFDEDRYDEVPVNTGVYYAKIRRPSWNGYAQGEDVEAEYHIKKATVEIIAEGIQRAAYNGDPKRVVASAEPDVPLSFSYYPNANAARAAIRALAQPDADARSGVSAALSGLRRVERAPIEQGAYYVVVYFPGDDNHNLAYREVVFTIGPPARRN
ncbi:hypothetical protein TREAZ_3012 [Leadbettera azotonutricia ZAS-9]|uniref:Uncharacterized protein n=2 Tax=Leadbettera azotonutricia TaxID=150829 RepID=F5YB57_LEAAZ|nr:hypothetical protein TREAZ_3012 [Leadbettera azotonutricia ZAS-9]